jgi:hypothetical protein
MQTQDIRASILPLHIRRRTVSGPTGGGAADVTAFEKA